MTRNQHCTHRLSARVHPRINPYDRGNDGSAKRDAGTAKEFWEYLTAPAGYRSFKTLSVACRYIKCNSLVALISYCSALSVIVNTEGLVNNVPNSPVHKLFVTDRVIHLLTIKLSFIWQPCTANRQRLISEVRLQQTVLCVGDLDHPT